MNPAVSMPRPRVAVVYDAFPHYRNGVIEELAASDACEYHFFGDAAYDDGSIKNYQFKSGQNFVRTRSLKFGLFRWQWNILTQILRRRITHCIFLGNPWFVSYWFLTPLLRLFGRSVYFWSHGWISRQEPMLRGAIKRTFFRLPHGLLLYGRRSKEIGVSLGFPATRMHVLGNSLDYKAQKAHFDSLHGVSRTVLRAELGLPADANIIICTARITRLCRFDLLLQAAHLLKMQRNEVFILLVGDGPERQTLAEMTGSLGIAHKFWGACYDEATIAKLHKASDLTVSPGKVGLTAMHSMAYGTPVVSHGNFDHQMPEFEAIAPGITGDFFAEDSSEDLARVIVRWFASHPLKPERECVCRIEAGFTPAIQRRVIEAALLGQEHRT